MTFSVEHPVVLTIPADSSYLRLVRLVVASMGADAPFDIEAVEDLRIAADELVTAVVGSANGHGTVSVEISLRDGAILLSARTHPAAAANPSPVTAILDPLASQILSVLVDEFSFESVDGGSVGTFRKAVPVV